MYAHTFAIEHKCHISSNQPAFNLLQQDMSTNMISDITVSADLKWLKFV